VLKQIRLTEKSKAEEADLFGEEEEAVEVERKINFGSQLAEETLLKALPTTAENKKNIKEEVSNLLESTDFDIDKLEQLASHFRKLDNCFSEFSYNLATVHSDLQNCLEAGYNRKKLFNYFSQVSHQESTKQIEDWIGYTDGTSQIYYNHLLRAKENLEDIIHRTLRKKQKAEQLRKEIVSCPSNRSQ